MPAFIRLDLFPAIVTMPDSTTFNPARAVVTDDTLYVYMDGNPPEEALSVKLYDFEKISRTQFSVTTDDSQQKINITKRSGCGCGSRLRGFRPFPGVPLLRK